jgi:hypothetical protein
MKIAMAGPKTRCPNYFTHSQKLANGRYLGALFLGESSRVGMVVELNPSGKVMWSMTELKEPTGVLRKPNGNTVIFQSGCKRVSEFTPEGKEVWGMQVFCQNGYASLQNLEDGKVFVSVGYQAMVIDGCGKIVTQREIPNMQRAHRF